MPIYANQAILRIGPARKLIRSAGSTTVLGSASSRQLFWQQSFYFLIKYEPLNLKYLFSAKITIYQQNLY